jgi:phosphoribosylformylglycinamidine cyclo-ligase
LRKVLARTNARPDQVFEGRPLGDVVMAPTRIYVKSVLSVLAQFRQDIKGLAHITGGGLLDNVPRILSPGLQAELARDAWTLPPLFAWLQKEGAVADNEMHRVFNCGIGMVVVVPAESAQAITSAFTKQGETVYTLGHIKACAADAAQTVVI